LIEEIKNQEPNGKRQINTKVKIDQIMGQLKKF
jgi:hypothetical protein